MSKIGFENFRRFADFPEMELAPITILVGENNAGKSTFVKGLLAFSDFLNSRSSLELLRKMREISFKSEYIRSKANEFDNKKFTELLKSKLKEEIKKIPFYFNSTYLAHIGTFKRALYNKSTNSVISFKGKFDDINITVSVTGNKNDEESVTGYLKEVSFYIKKLRISIYCDFINDKTTFTLHKTNREKISNPPVIIIDKDYVIENKISNIISPFSQNVISMIIESWDRYFSYIFKDEKRKERFEGETSLGRTGISRYDSSKVDEETLKMFRKWYSLGGRHVHDSPLRFFSYYYPQNFIIDYEYIYAHAVSQTVIYSAKDSNDYLSRTVHEFSQYQHVNKKRDFIIKWMKEFGIGKNFSIKSVGGEAHVVYIINQDDEKVNLADKGMGSIQLMVLLFRLAITLPDNPQRTRIIRVGLMEVEMDPKRIIIEEPEQNLHPKLQSKLTELFYEMNVVYGYNFLIETHSEYLVRRSQVIVANENKKADAKNEEWENPFRVYYFPSSGTRYDMEYAKDGYFEKPFGKGFFNVASELSLDLDRIEEGTYDERQS